MHKYTIEINGCELVDVETELDLEDDDETIPNSFNEELKKAYFKEYGEEYYEEISHWKIKVTFN